jgi:hypothetical protein
MNKNISFLHSDGVQRQICIGETIVIYGLGYQNFFRQQFFSVHSWLTALQSIQKRRHHLTTFPWDFTFRPQNDISEAALLAEIYVSEILSLVHQILLRVAWLAWSVLSDMQALLFSAKRKAVYRGHWHGGLFLYPLLEQKALFTRELGAFSASDDLTTFTNFTSSFSSACTMLFIPYF